MRRERVQEGPRPGKSPDENRAEDERDAEKEESEHEPIDSAGKRDVAGEKEPHYARASQSGGADHAGALCGHDLVEYRWFHAQEAALDEAHTEPEQHQ
jgi:hypothetical protein